MQKYHELNIIYILNIKIYIFQIILFFIITEPV